MDTRVIVRADGGRAAWVGFTPAGLSILLFALIVAVLPRLSEAAPCTKGVDCYCDKVQSGSLNDPQLLMCEDFEAPTLRLNQGYGNGAPYYGPPYDDSDKSFAFNRGSNSYWFKRFAYGTQGSHISPGTPASPKLGITCGDTGDRLGYTLCYGHKIWHPTDLWQGNSGARIAILTDNDFGAEVPSIKPPTGKAGGGAGAFDGAASYGARTIPGVEGGFAGGRSWSAQRNIGITEAVAYPNNIQTSGIVNGPWKGNEWGPHDHGMFMFHDGGGLTSTFPFYGFFFQTSLGNTTACNAALAGATISAGTFNCNGNGVTWRPTNYNRATDWPLGTWACVRGYYQNIGLSNMAWKITFTGPSGVEKTVTQISNFNGTILNVGSGMTGFAFDNYANVNNGYPESTPTNQVTFRYEDNIHIRAGAPVSCAQIGFGASGGSADSVAPSTPSGVGVR
jgi:hypothetical protein